MTVRDGIYRQIIERGWRPARRAFVQHYDTDVLDASLLLIPLCKFIAPTDPRWISTLDAITAELVSDSLVYRYNVEAAPDGQCRPALTAAAAGARVGAVRCGS
jgi:GH15 family glucan-1,4-alpha-glucosidase